VRKHLENNIKVITVIFQLRPLIRVQDVFLYERVEPVTFPEFPDDLDVMDPVNVQPGY
jgi:hypothetical protein